MITITEGRIGMKEDAKILADIDRQCFEYDAVVEEDWLKILDNNTKIYLALDNESSKIIGAAVLRMTLVNICYLYSNAVLPAYRGQKIGTRLLEARMNDAFKFNPNILIQAHTRIDNKVSIRLLSSKNFLPITYVTDYYGDFQDAILWEY